MQHDDRSFAEENAFIHARIFRVFYVTKFLGFESFITFLIRESSEVKML
jgi:hypothetical protein